MTASLTPNPFRQPKTIDHTNGRGNKVFGYDYEMCIRLAVLLVKEILISQSHS